MTIDQVIALSSSIGAFLSAGATFLTVREMQKQRSASFRPELVFPRVHFCANKNPISATPIPSEWQEDTSGSGVFADSENAPPRKSLAIPILNVGLGAARSVSLVWSFPVDDMIFQANTYAKTGTSSIAFSVDKVGISLTQDGGRGETSLWRNQQHVTLDYVLPTSSEVTHQTISLPHAYTFLCSAWIHLGMTRKGGLASVELPPLTATIEYLDIADQLHRRQFTFKADIRAIAGNGSAFDGYVDCAAVSK
ncbi:UNVERIFIED_ORG: hypothetical protein J2Y81_005417 [Paraburkholderia sediminicola]|nr:hypothetical protein [Paraburkholderia sediminicola]